MSSVLVSCFLTNERDKIEKILGCKTIDYFIEEDEFMLISSVLE